MNDTRSRENVIKGALYIISIVTGLMQITLGANVHIVSRTVKFIIKAVELRLNKLGSLSRAP